MSQEVKWWWWWRPTGYKHFMPSFNMNDIEFRNKTNPVLWISVLLMLTFPVSGQNLTEKDNRYSYGTCRETGSPAGSELFSGLDQLPDSIRKVYHAHRKLWDNCYAMIFGADNSAKFNTETGMVAWNKTLYPDNYVFFNKKASALEKLKPDSILRINLERFGKLVPYQVKATISILFTPITGIQFGGCDNDQFCIELNYGEQDIEYTILRGMPHELNHLAYGPLREEDPDKNTALRQTIDEGFACYFTWVFFERKIPKWEVVENMSEKDWNWYVAHEREILTSLRKYFTDESGENPLLRNDKMKLFPDAPKSLNYWLGFRIIEKYVEKHGTDSWKDIYTLNVSEVLEKSHYNP
jgi:hypothetical protein